MSDDVCKFLDTLDCPKFTYDDVLACYAYFIASEWNVDTIERVPIPRQSELSPSQTIRLNVVRKRQTNRKRHRK